MVISKSDFMAYLKHPAWLWLKKYKKALLPPVDEATQALFDAGYEFETFAQKLFPDAVRLGFEDYSQYLLLPQETKKAIEGNAKVISQGRLEADNLTCIFDILERVEGNTFDLYEIKSSTKVKAEHETDLAFQTIVLEKAGISVRSIGIIYVNSAYIRSGEIEIDKITLKKDVTLSVRAQIPSVAIEIQKAFKLLSQKTMPDISPRYATSRGLTQWMDVFRHIQTLDEYSLYDLCSLTPEQIGQLEDLKVTKIVDIPEEKIEKPKQLHQIQATKKNQRIVDNKKIKEFLDKWQYPLYFFDYETFASAIPAFDDLQPYKDYPFQYSLHIIRSPDGPLEHREYLHTQNSNPIRSLVAKLKEDIGDSGTIVSWSQAYERNINKTVAELYPDLAECMLTINKRMEDLMIPFWQDWIVDPQFMGSASIKKVLPAMVPELSYKNLAVSNGQSARNIWMDTVLKQSNQDSKEHIFDNLREYCTLDTFAMVRIWQELQKIDKRA